MILGISSFTYGWAILGSENLSPLNEQDLILRTKDLGLKCLQIGDNLPLHTFSGETLAKLKTSAQNANIRLETGARGLTEKHLQRYVDVAAFLRSPLLRFVIDGVDYQPDVDTIIAILKNALPELKKRNITLGLENHDRFKAIELSKIMERLSDQAIGICLDTVNSIGAGEGIEWVTGILAPFTVNLHIKEFTIRRYPHNMGFTVDGAPLGNGMLNLPFIITKLLQFNRCQSAVLEQWVPLEATADATITKEKRWADDGIRWLKQLAYF